MHERTTLRVVCDGRQTEMLKLVMSVQTGKWRVRFSVQIAYSRIPPLEIDGDGWLCGKPK